MTIAMLEGMNDSYSMDGFSRVTPTQDEYMNGFSRVNYMGDLMLSGLVLSGHKANEMTKEDFMCYLEECAMKGSKPSSREFAQYMMQGRAERRARRQARRDRRAQRKSQRGRRREARTVSREGKARRQATGDTGFQRFLATAKDITGDIFGPENVQTVVEDLAPGVADLGLFDPMAEPGAMDKGYLIGKPPFEPWTGRWWSSSRVPVWQKAAVGVGGLVLVDQVALKGKFTNPLIGKKARK